MIQLRNIKKEALIGIVNIQSQIINENIEKIKELENKIKTQKEIINNLKIERR